MSGLVPVPFSKARARLPRLSEPYVAGKRHQRFWTEAEDAVIRAHFPQGGGKGCKLHLPHRALGAIYQRANTLGVKAAAKGGSTARRNRHVASAELDDRIRAAWPELSPGRGGIAALAESLGVPRRFLYDRALALGLDLRPYKKQPPWTKAEDELMREAPLHQPERAARVFKQHGYNRSPTAIMVRAKRLELSRRASRKTLSARGAAAILGMDAKNLAAQYIIPGLLKATKRDDRRLPQQGGAAWDIERAELRRFVIDQLERIDFRKVDKFALVDLLTNGGAETGEGGTTADRRDPPPDRPGEASGPAFFRPRHGRAA